MGPSVGDPRDIPPPQVAVKLRACRSAGTGLARRRPEQDQPGVKLGGAPGTTLSPPNDAKSACPAGVVARKPTRPRPRAVRNPALTASGFFAAACAAASSLDVNPPVASCWEVARDGGGLGSHGRIAVEASVNPTLPAISARSSAVSGLVPPVPVISSCWLGVVDCPGV